MTDPIVITLSMAREANNNRDLWRASAFGETLVERSATPLRDACRRLLRVGHDPSRLVTVKYANDESGAHITTTLLHGAELEPAGTK